MCRALSVGWSTVSRIRSARGRGMRVQRVVMPDGSGSWTVLDDLGEVIGPAEALLAHLQALNRSPETVRTYAISLKLWWEFLGGAGGGGERGGAGGRLGALLAGDAEPAPGRAVQLLRLPRP